MLVINFIFNFFLINFALHLYPFKLSILPELTSAYFIYLSVLFDFDDAK